MAQQGGYRQPNNPAPVSGPGAMSQRTDGGPADTQASKYISGLPYGEGQEMMNIQGSAPMAAAAQMPVSAPVVPLSAPTQRAGEPVTSGVDAGLGPDMSSLGLGSKDVAADESFRASLAAYMPVLMQVASRPDTSPETRNVIRQLRELI